MCCPKASTRSGTMGCGVPSIVPSCTNSSSRWRGTHPPRLHSPCTGEPCRPTAGAPPLRAGQPCPHCGQGLLVVIRSLPRHPRGPHESHSFRRGLHPFRIIAATVCRTVAPWHRSVRLSKPFQGARFPSHLLVLGPPERPTLPLSSPPMDSRHPPPRSARNRFSSGPGCIKIP